MKLTILISLLAVASARMAHQFPSGAEVLRSNIATSFSCAGRAYGYYADPANDCQVFHVCYPVNDESGNLLEDAHFSFICGNQTVFSQESLTCTFVEDAFPCDQAASLYELSNSEFGKVPDKN